MGETVSQHEPVDQVSGQRGSAVAQPSLLAVWAVRYLLIPLLMSAMAAIAAAVLQAREASGREYHGLVKNWPQFSQQLRQDIAADLADGKISRWESVILDRKVLDELRALEIEMVDRDLDTERAALTRLVETGNLRH